MEACNHYYSCGHIVIKEMEREIYKDVQFSESHNAMCIKIVPSAMVFNIVELPQDILHEEFENIVVQTKFRPQSARRDISDAALKLF